MCRVNKTTRSGILKIIVEDLSLDLSLTVIVGDLKAEPLLNIFKVAQNLLKV
jgi:hypothetical protein